MAEPLTCLDCGMADPPPEQTCPGPRRPGRPGITVMRDHYVGTERGCPACGRLELACVRRPCAARREAHHG